MLTELQARSLRNDELADRLRYHSEPGVAELAQRFFGSDMDSELAETKRELAEAHDEIDDERRRAARLEALLSEVLDEEGELPADLLKRIQAEI